MLPSLYPRISAAFLLSFSFLSNRHTIAYSTWPRSMMLTRNKLTVGQDYYYENLPTCGRSVPLIYDLLPGTMMMCYQKLEAPRVVVHSSAMTT